MPALEVLFLGRMESRQSRVRRQWLWQYRDDGKDDCAGIVPKLVRLLLHINV